MTREIATVFRYALFNVLRTKWLPLYGMFFLVFAGALLRFTSDPVKAVASLLNVVLLVVPMVSALYGAISWYHSDAFVHLLLTQPVRRSSVILATWLAISAGLAVCFIVGAGVPLLVFLPFRASSLLLLAIGALLTSAFMGIGMLVAVWNPDRMRGIGLTIIAWLYFEILHDAGVFFLVSVFRDYPIEIPSMILMALNPIDLARVSMLLFLDLSAMMGYTGRVLQRVISSPAGMALTLGALHAWAIFPVLAAVHRFRKRDL